MPQRQRASALQHKCQLLFFGTNLRFFGQTQRQAAAICAFMSTRHLVLPRPAAVLAEKPKSNCCMEASLEAKAKGERLLRNRYANDTRTLQLNKFSDRTCFDRPFSDGGA